MDSALCTPGLIPQTQTLPIPLKHEKLFSYWGSTQPSGIPPSDYCFQSYFCHYPAYYSFLCQPQLTWHLSLTCAPLLALWQSSDLSIRTPPWSAHPSSHLCQLPHCSLYTPGLPPPPRTQCALTPQCGSPFIFCSLQEALIQFSSLSERKMEKRKLERGGLAIHS